MSETNSTLQKIEQWEEAWADYIFSLEVMEREDVVGEDFVYWCEVDGRRLDEAKRRLNSLDPDFCKRLDLDI